MSRNIKNSSEHATAEASRKRKVAVEKVILGTDRSLKALMINDGVHEAPTLLDINGVIGKGGFSIVHDGRFGNKPVAVKIYKEDRASNSSSWKFIEREIKIHSSLKSPHIVAVLFAISYLHQNISRQLLILERCSCDLESHLNSIGGRINDQDSIALVRDVTGTFLQKYLGYASHLWYREHKPTIFVQELVMLK